MTGRNAGIERAWLKDQPLFVHERTIRLHRTLRGAPQHFSGFDIEDGTVPRTFDAVFGERSFVQRTSQVGAEGADREQRASNVEHRDRLAVGVDLNTLAFGGRGEPPDQNPGPRGRLHARGMGSRLMRFPSASVRRKPKPILVPASVGTEAHVDTSSSATNPVFHMGSPEGKTASCG